MKKVLFLFVALATVACISCKKSETSATETSTADTTAVTDTTTATDSTAVAETPAATPVEEQVQIPTYKQAWDVFYGKKSVLNKLGIKCLRKNLSEYDGDTVGSVYYGKDAEVDGNGKITPKGEHAIVIEANQGGEVSSVTINFSNQDDYNTYLQNNKKGETGQNNGLYYVTYDDQGE